MRGRGARATLAQFHDMLQHVLKPMHIYPCTSDQILAYLPLHLAPLIRSMHIYPCLSDLIRSCNLMTCSRRAPGHRSCRGIAARAARRPHTYIYSSILIHPYSVPQRERHEGWAEEASCSHSGEGPALPPADVHLPEVAGQRVRVRA